MRALRWFVVNAAMWALLYFGAFGGVEWARNLFVFWVWMSLAIGLIVVLAHLVAAAGEPEESAIAAARSSVSRDVPRWLSWPYDVVTVCVLAAVGWFATATGYILLIVVGAFIRAAAQQVCKVAEAATA